MFVSVIVEATVKLSAPTCRDLTSFYRQRVPQETSYSIDSTRLRCLRKAAFAKCMSQNGQLVNATNFSKNYRIFRKKNPLGSKSAKFKTEFSLNHAYLHIQIKKINQRQNKTLVNTKLNLWKH